MTCSLHSATWQDPPPPVPVFLFPLGGPERKQAPHLFSSRRAVDGGGRGRLFEPRRWGGPGLLAHAGARDRSAVQDAANFFVGAGVVVIALAVSFAESLPWDGCVRVAEETRQMTNNVSHVPYLRDSLERISCPSTCKVL